jgi:nucleoside diphosphate kinase
MVTPESLAKARVGGIIARLFATPGLEVVGSRMYAPSQGLQKELVQVLERAGAEDGNVDNYEQALIDFVAGSLGREQCAAKGIHHAMLLLLFKGTGARRTLERVVGENLPPAAEWGRTIRGTYGDYALAQDGSVVDFHPAVLTPTTDRSNREALALFAKYADKDGGVLQKPAHPETGLVMIKPDNLSRPSALPGHIIDILGTTGLTIVGTKVLSLSLNQGKEFYGFLEGIFEKKLVPQIAATLKSRLTGAFPYDVSEEKLLEMAGVLRREHARSEVARIIEYMTGFPPSAGLNAAQAAAVGPAKCMALLYRGPDCIARIRAKLGATDPSKAAEATIRADYGRDLMRNGAHASDSAESAARERAIIGLKDDSPSSEKTLIEKWLSATA